MNKTIVSRPDSLVPPRCPRICRRTGVEDKTWRWWPADIGMETRRCCPTKHRRGTTTWHSTETERCGRICYDVLYLYGTFCEGILLNAACEQWAEKLGPERWDWRRTWGPARASRARALCVHRTEPSRARARIRCCRRRCRGSPRAPSPCVPAVRPPPLRIRTLSSGMRPARRAPPEASAQPAHAE